MTEINGIEYINNVLPAELNKENNADLKNAEKTNDSTKSTVSEFKQSEKENIHRLLEGTEFDKLANTEIRGKSIVDIWIDEIEGRGASLKYTPRLKRLKLIRIFEKQENIDKVITATLELISKENESIKNTRAAYKDLLDNEPNLTEPQRKLLTGYQDSKLFYSAVTSKLTDDADLIEISSSVLETTQTLVKQRKHIEQTTKENIFNPIRNISYLYKNQEDADAINKVNFIFSILNAKIKDSDISEEKKIKDLINKFQGEVDANSDVASVTWAGLVDEAQKYYETAMLDKVTTKNIKMLYSMSSNLDGEKDSLILEAVSNKSLDKIEQKEFISRYKDDKNFRILLKNSGVDLKETIDELLYVEATNKLLFKSQSEYFRNNLDFKAVKVNDDLANRYITALGKDYSQMKWYEKAELLETIAPEELELAAANVYDDWEREDLDKFMSGRFAQIEQVHNINAQGKNIIAGLAEINNSLNNQTQVIGEFADNFSNFADDITALGSTQVQQLIDVNKQLNSIGKNTANIEAYTRAITRTQLVELEKNKYFKDIVPEITKLLPEDEQVDLETFLKKVDVCVKKEKSAERRKKIIKAALVVAGVVAAGAAVYYFGPAVVTHLASGLPSATPAIASPVLASTLGQANIMKQTGTTTLMDNPSFGTTAASDAIKTLKGIGTGDALRAADEINSRWSSMGAGEINSIVSKHMNLKAKYEAADAARKIAEAAAKK